jgi:hypothetical protein
MAYVEWHIEGAELTSCNCEVGCPCQFNAPPSHGDCRAYMFMQIDRGRFGDLILDGLRWGALFAWPGPIHLGGGTAMVVVQEGASPEQRAAIETVASGRETVPGSLITQVFSTTLSSVLPTQVRPIDLTIDLQARSGRVRVPGLLDGAAESIRNPVTGEPHVVSVRLPNGFEYTEAEFLRGTAKASGPIELVLDGTHAHVAKVHWSTHGVVR